MIDTIYLVYDKDKNLIGCARNSGWVFEIIREAGLREYEVKKVLYAHDGGEE